MKGGNMKRVGGFLLEFLKALAIVFVAQVFWFMGQYYSPGFDLLLAEFFDAVTWLLSVSIAGVI